MDIGNREVVAARYSVFYEEPERFLDGDLSFFVHGEEIGDPSRIVELEDILNSMTYILGDRGRRRADALYRAPAMDVMLSLDAELYSAPCCTASFTPVPLPEEPARFDLNLGIEAFAGWRLYLIDGPESSRFIYYFSEWDEPRETQVPLGSFDAVLHQLSESLERIVQSHSEVRHGSRMRLPFQPYNGDQKVDRGEFLYGRKEEDLEDARSIIESVVRLELEQHESSHWGGLYYRFNDQQTLLLLIRNWDIVEETPAEPTFYDYETLLIVSSSKEAWVDTGLAGKLAPWFTLLETR